MTMHGDRWGQKIAGGTLCKVYDCLVTNAVHLKPIQHTDEGKL